MMIFSLLSCCKETRFMSGLCCLCVCTRASVCLLSVCLSPTLQILNQFVATHVAFGTGMGDKYKPRKPSLEKHPPLKI